MTADELLAQAKKWTRDPAKSRSKRSYALVDPTITHLGAAGWNATEITNALIVRKAWPTSQRRALYHHVRRKIG